MTDKGYHGAANTTEPYPDDNSLQSIVQLQYSQMHNLHLPNNATAQQTNDSVSNIRRLL